MESFKRRALTVPSGKIGNGTTKREEMSIMRRNLQPHGGRAARPWCMALAVLVTAAGLCFGAGSARAQDVKSYTRATFDEWLAKYKDAKPDFKVGDVLTAKDIERMRQFVFPGYVEQ